MVVPFLLGAVLALSLYPRLAAGEVPFTSFALFLAITTYPPGGTRAPTGNV